MFPLAVSMSTLVLSRGAVPTPVPSPTTTVVVAGLGTHDLFDVLASLVVPVLIGLVTLVVSVASLRIAQLALKTARDANELEGLRRREELRRRRYEQVPAFQQWFVERVRLGRTDFTSLETQQAMNAESKLIRELEAASELEATVFVEMLSTRVEDRQREGVDEQQIVAEGLIDINMWARDPESVGPISWPHCL